MQITGNNKKAIKLTRSFSLTSILVIGIASAAVGYMYRTIAVTDLKSLGEAGNTILTQAVANAVLPNIMALQKSSPTNQSEYDHIDKIISKVVSDTPVLKVKAFDLNRSVIYSTVRKEVGDVKDRDYPGSISISTGKVISSLSHHDSFASINGNMKDITVLSTYLPIYNPENMNIEGVFEIYSDVTELYQRITFSQLTFIAGIIVIFGLVHAVLYTFIYRAERVLVDQMKKREKDIETIKMINKDLQSARDQAMSASRLKSKFLANMSHELRTPLNAIIGYSEMLAEDAADDSSAIDDLERIQFSGRHLLSIINEILDLSKIEAGSMELDYSNVNLQSMLDDVKDTVLPLATSGNNIFIIENNTSLGTIVTDAKRMRQILFNLIGNACKFTSNGKIILSIKTVQVDGEIYIEYLVKDTGIGMSDKEMKRIFKPFKQADSSATRKHGGTGLGLTISQRLCEMMNGRIEVSSIPGAGTSFRVMLPVNQGISDIQFGIEMEAG